MNKIAFEEDAYRPHRWPPLDVSTGGVPRSDIQVRDAPMGGGYLRGGGLPTYRTMYVKWKHYIIQLPLRTVIALQAA